MDQFWTCSHHGILGNAGIFLCLAMSNRVTVEWLLQQLSDWLWKQKSTNHNATIIRVCTNRPLSCIFWSPKKEAQNDNQHPIFNLPVVPPPTRTSPNSAWARRRRAAAWASACRTSEYYLSADEGNGCWNKSLLNTLVCPSHTLSYPQDTLYGDNNKTPTKYSKVWMWSNDIRIILFSGTVTKESSSYQLHYRRTLVSRSWSSFFNKLKGEVGWSYVQRTWSNDIIIWVIPKIVVPQNGWFIYNGNPY